MSKGHTQANDAKSKSSYAVYIGFVAVVIAACYVLDLPSKVTISE